MNTSKFGYIPPFVSNSYISARFSPLHGFKPSPPITSNHGSLIEQPKPILLIVGIIGVTVLIYSHIAFDYVDKEESMTQQPTIMITC